MKRSAQELSLTYFISDLFALNATLFAALSFYGVRLVFQYDGLTMVALSLLWVMCSTFNKVYQLHLYNSFRLRTLNSLKSHFAFIGTVSAIYLVFTLPNYIKAVMIMFVVAFPVVNLAINYLVFKIIGSLRLDATKARKALIVGAGKAGVNIYKHFNANPDFGYKVIGFLEDHPYYSPVKNIVIGNLSDIEDVLEQQHVDEVIIAISADNTTAVQSIVKTADYHGIRTCFAPDYAHLLGSSNYNLSRLGSIPVINVREISLDKLSFATFKRIFDMLFSVAALVALAPLFAFLAIAIKIDSPGAVFYCPIRVGRDGKTFRLYKFRSMIGGDNSGTLSTEENDSRITRLGRIIRKYSLDELPQFWNVLMGHMSVVGPRPHRVYLDKVMQKEVNNYMLRHYLKPGITGWAQVNGWRGLTETEEQRAQRTEHDLWYMENWSLSLDIKIIYLTVFSEKTHQVAF